MKLSLPLILHLLTKDEVNASTAPPSSFILPPSSLLSSPQVEPAPVGERVGVALTLLAVVLAVLVARAVAALRPFGRERAPARDCVMRLQMAAVPADPLVH